MKREFPNAKMVNPQAWNYVEKFENVPANIEYIMFHKHADEIFFDSPVYPMAKYMFEKLVEIAKTYRGQVVVVTKQASKFGEATLRWLAKHEFPAETIYIVNYHKSKLIAECDILIDDSPKNLREQESVYGGVLCVKRPWNHDWEGKRIDNYNSIILEVQEYVEDMETLELEFTRLTPEEQRDAMYEGIAQIIKE